METTNTMEFCVSCHEMRGTVHVECKQSIHFKNAFGVRAVGLDCHLLVAHGTELSGWSTCVDCHKGIAHKLSKQRDG